MSRNLPPSSQQNNARRQRPLRWLALLFASVVLHILAISGADDYLGLPSWHNAQPEVIVTQLHRPPIESEKPKATPVAPKRAPKPRQPPPPPVPEAVADAPPSGMEVPGTSAEPVAEQLAAVPAEPATSATPAEPTEATASPPKLSPPPSAELKYAVEAKRDGKEWHGKGMFRWESSGEAYRITGEASITILFKITVLNFKSEGVLNEVGIAPVLYSEQPWRKSMTNTHFQHANRKITFSASQAAYPYRGGEQDRASIMWQLASIGRGDATQFAPGTEFDIVVAGARDADTWRIQVVGLEEISTPLSKMAVWHLVRTPRPGTHDQKLDMWLAPAHEWFPVRLRYTYANGDYLDMSLAELTMQGAADAAERKE